MRINARLDDSYERKFQLVQQRERKNRSDILKEALDSYFATKLRQDEDEALAKNQKLLQMLGGIMSAPADSSVNYKKYVKGYLDEKFGHR
ncbi:MAG: hypothetical protein PHE17_03470 [Thiothrix sp.]|uniref:hypothetical protein n=1 Tax=Thiothrix sp. TaxID=1032 RepID=UPI002625EA31|nr:hypothetical protein [Thiothrix sp.]MDD5392060.1 hypothetical protein [Thiothrix sp.]